MATAIFATSSAEVVWAINGLAAGVNHSIQRHNNIRGRLASMT
jgi:hypothetical protein